MSADPLGNSRKLETLRAIMAALRTPVTGCPWDLDQNFRTIAPYTIEEAYEVADAIERNDMGDLCDELGDLLLQVVYHAQMASEASSFDFDDVVEAVSTKLVRRHPHVFGDAEARDAGAVKGFWERIKAEERIRKADASGKNDREQESALDDVPIVLPGLTRAVKLQKRAARVGFDWPELAPVLDKIEEEVGELRQSLGGKSRDDVAEEYGDLLFAVANLGRHLDVDADTALRAANAKFERRFRAIEAKLHERGKAPAQSTLAELDALWDLVKEEEKVG